VIGSRCRLRGENPLCPVEIQDPQPNITALEDVRIMYMCTSNYNTVGPPLIQARNRTEKSVHLSEVSLFHVIILYGV
jgi:hypothetical protein